MTETFAVKVGEFEGPLDLLLQLVEKRQLHISQVALAAVADDFVAYLQGSAEASLGGMADFLFVASTLMLIKSSALLPKLTLTTEETSDMAELERRLKVYQRLKAASLLLGANWWRQPGFFRPASPPGVVFSPPATIATMPWAAILRALLKTLPIATPPPEATVRRVVNLETVIADLATRVERALNLTFRQFAGHHKERVDVIVSFLGLLELVRRGGIAVRQDAHFQDIQMETLSTGTPRY